MLETDGFVHRPRDRAGQRRVRHPRLRQRPRRDQELRRLLQRGLGHLPRIGLGPQRRQHRAARPARYAIEIHNNRSHDNTLGYSGTAGNSIWAHDNHFYRNATGIATDSLFPGHPGLPQDHARWSGNRIYHNNRNWYTEFVDKGVCAKPMEERGYMQGAVCPVVPTPVGTGVLIAGGNYNSTDHNWIYDNWRYGTMQFWVPAPLRDEYDPAKLNDTSHHNHTTENRMGFRAGRLDAHNGMDHWWDDQGNGNCWEGNTYSRGHQTDNFTLDPPSCADGGSTFTPGLPVKDAGFLSCSQYDRSDETWRHPPACTWFDSPSKPTGADPSPVELAASAGRLLTGVGHGCRATPRPACLRRRAPATCLERTTCCAVVGQLDSSCSRSAWRSCWSPGSGTPPYARGRRRSSRGTHPGVGDGGQRGLHDRRPQDQAGPLPRPRHADLPVPADQHRPPAGHRDRDRPGPARRPALRLRRARGTGGRERFSVPGHGSREVRLLLRMGGCESLSARAGSFASSVLVRTERMGISTGSVRVELPEEIHTGSPREAFCPNSTAKSRPPG